MEMVLVFTEASPRLLGEINRDTGADSQIRTTLFSLSWMRAC